MKIAVTGTTTGIGRSTADLLINKGHQVFEINRPEWDHHNLEKLRTIPLYGYDVLICNAGHDRGHHKFLTASYKDWMDVMKVNQLAPMILTQQFTRQNKSGTIIYMTTHYDKGSSSAGAYHTAKAGLKFLIEQMRQENKNYRFVDFSLGRIKTNMRKNWNIKLSKEQAKWTKHIEPEDVAVQVEHVINNEHVTDIYVKHIKR